MSQQDDAELRSNFSEIEKQLEVPTCAGMYQSFSLRPVDETYKK